MEKTANIPTVVESKSQSNVFICFANEERDFVHDLDDLLRKTRRVSAR